MVGILLKALFAIALAGLVNILYHLYNVRMHVRRVKSKYGIDILPHSFLFGHLLVIDEVMRKTSFPPKAHSQWLPMLFAERYPELVKKGILYLDIWPISEPLLLIYNPEMMAQVTDGNFPKSKLMVMEMGPATGAKDILTLEGQQWKRARAMFNPGFSAKNLTSLIPEFLEDIQTFRAKLKGAAEKGGVIRLEDWTTQLAVDVIGHAVLGVRLNSQIKAPPLIKTMKLQLPLLYNMLDFRKLFNPARYFKLWLYRRRFYNLLVPYIREVVQDHDTSAGPKTILKLALKERASETKNFESHIDDFIKDQVGHFWMFLFAGHDTTGITIAFAFYLLGRNPEKARKIREEHDRVLGPDPARAADMLRNDLSLVNQLPYTTAVFKETLRLFSPVSGGVRSTSDGFFVTHPQTGERFPTWGFMVNGAGAVLHRLSEYWPEPHQFLPERWLIKDPTDPFYVRKDAYRPFEAGQRNCIGQELVSIEARLVLALTAREFEVEDALPDDGLSLFGEKQYQVEIPESVATARARDGMPVVVKAR